MSGEATGTRPLGTSGGTVLSPIAAVPAAGEPGAGIAADDRGGPVTAAAPAGRAVADENVAALAGIAAGRPGT